MVLARKVLHTTTADGFSGRELPLLKDIDNETLHDTDEELGLKQWTNDATINPQHP